MIMSYETKKYPPYLFLSKYKPSQSDRIYIYILGINNVQLLHTLMLHGDLVAASTEACMPACPCSTLPTNGTFTVIKSFNSVRIISIYYICVFLFKNKQTNEQA